ncbi:MAG: GTPase domain-containing protein [Hyphomonadaceae bacterium]|nr:GTPase domain-containing protein [Hyphomonadaceae bacterium]
MLTPIFVAVLLVGALLFLFVVAFSGKAKPRPVTMLVCGATGVGKSTLINVLSGREAAKTGIGAPVTQNTSMIAAVDKGLAFYDSKGLEVEEASQTYLLLLSDILSLRYGPVIRAHIDLVVMCIQEPQGRIDDAHREIAGLCDDLRIPLGVVITKSLGDAELAETAKEVFANAKFVRRVRSLPLKLPGVPTPVPAEGLSELLDDIRISANWDPVEARRRAATSVKTRALSSSARELASSGGKSDWAWIGFARAASSLLEVPPKQWDLLLGAMRDDARKSLVPDFLNRVLFTRFDNSKIDGACARRLVPVILRRFADGAKEIKFADRTAAVSEAVEFLRDNRPYRARF